MVVMEVMEAVMVVEEVEVCIFPLAVIDRWFSLTYCTPFQAMEDVVVDMTIVAEVCSLLRRLAGFVCFHLLTGCRLGYGGGMCFVSCCIDLFVLFFVSNTQSTPFRLWRRYVIL